MKNENKTSCLSAHPSSEISTIASLPRSSRRQSTEKGRKSTKSLKLCVIILLVSVIQSVSAQIPSNVDIPGVVLNAKQYHSYLSDGLSASSTDHREEWLFDVIESQEGDYYSVGFVDPPFGTSGNRRRPALVKFDSDLNKIWDINYDQITYAGVDYNIKESKFVELVEDDQQMIYTVGNCKLEMVQSPYTSTNWVGMVTKVDKNGITQSGYPKILSSALTLESRADAILIDDVRNYIYVSGKNSGDMWLAKYDKNFNQITSTNFSNTDGRALEMCFGYPNGSVPGGKPFNNTDLVGSIMLTGCVATGNTGLNELDIFVYKISHSTLSTVASKIFDSQNFTNYNLVDWPRNTAVCPNISGLENFDDVAQSIEQNINGDFLIAGQYNWQHALTNVACTSVSNPETPCHIREQIEASDGMLIVIDDNLSTLTEQHIGRFEGDDFWFSAKFDYDGNIYALGTTANPDRTLADPHCTINTRKCQDNFMLIKADYDPATYTISYKWHKEFYGGYESSSCGFDLMINSDNNVICVGNNHYQHENWDIVEISNDCIQNDPNKPVSTLPLNGYVSGTKIFSVKQHMDNNHPGSTVWTIGSNKVIEGQIVIESGYKLRLPITGTTLEFADARSLGDLYVQNSMYNTAAGIIILDGGELEIENGSELTALKNTSCFSTWGGVQLGMQSSWGTEPVFIMTNSTISNATKGLSGYNGNFELTNGTLVNPINGFHYNNVVNFVNNNVSIDYSEGDFNPYQSRIFCQNFECNDKTSYSNGLDYFIKANDFKLIKLEGCSFKNSYFGNLGMCSGISAFNSQIDVFFADTDPMNTGLCHPTAWRPSSFEGLYTAIRHGSPSQHPQARLRVMEAEFTNNKEAIIDGAGRDNVIYKNNISWDNAYPFMSNNDYKLGVFNSWAYSTKIYENEITNDNNSRDFIALYTNQNAWHSSIGGHNVTGNIINNLGPNRLGIGHQMDGDNSELQVSCNSYDGLSSPWLVNGLLMNQGSLASSNGNSWEACTGGQMNIDGLASPAFFYYPGPTDMPGTCIIPFVVTLGSLAPSDKACVAIDPCTMYSPSTGGDDNGDWDIDAMVDVSDQEKMVDDFFRGDYASVSAALSQLSYTEQYADLDVVISAVLPAFQEGRKFNLNSSEVSFLKSKAIGQSYTNMIANDILFFYADQRVTQVFDMPSSEPSSAPSQETADISTELALDRVSIYPNPAQSYVQVSVHGQESFTGQLLDLHGKSLMAIDSSNGSKIDISTLSAGVYFIRIQFSDINELHKLIVR